MMRAMRALLLVVAAAMLAGCKFPYPADVPDDDAEVDAGACTPSTTTCVDATLIVCDADGVPTETACTFGCAPGGDRCGDLAPSNGLAPYLDQARNAAPVVLAGTALIDTDTGRVTVDGNIVAVQTAVASSAPVEILVIIAKTFEADDVTARGRRALAIVSDGDVVLHGTLSVSASHEVPGAGAGSAGDPTCDATRGTSGSAGTGGAGGGGFGTTGGRGGTGGPNAGGNAGSVVGTAALAPLRGGCPGAFKNVIPNADPEAEQAGAGGGAIQISARGALRLDATAFIAASGGGAKGITGDFMCFELAGDPPRCRAGSGGGAGGGILLEATTVQVPPSAGIVANGGAGHCSAYGLASDGVLSESSAPGTDCSSVAEAGSGGAGGAGSLGGFNGTAGQATGGGGGGGAGRIRINLPPLVVFDPGPPIVSPAPSLGAVATR